MQPTNNDDDIPVWPDKYFFAWRWQANDHEVKLSISLALAQSCKLAVYEERIGLLVEEVRFLPEDLAEYGEVRMSRRQVGRTDNAEEYNILTSFSVLLYVVRWQNWWARFSFRNQPLICCPPFLTHPNSSGNKMFRTAVRCCMKRYANLHQALNCWLALYFSLTKCRFVNIENWRGVSRWGDFCFLFRRQLSHNGASFIFFFSL